MLRPTMIFFAITLSASAFASNYLNADQAKALFTGKTFDGLDIKPDGKRNKYWGYENPNGEHIIKNGKGKILEPRKWWIDDQGRHCTTRPQNPDGRCTHVKDLGGGVYGKFDETGTQTNELSNFREGNQL